MFKSKRLLKSVISVCMAVIIVFGTMISISATNEFSTSGSISKNQRPTGALPDTRPATPDTSSNVATFSTRSLPSSVDLSQSVSFPPVGNQWYVSSCVAWAAAYYQFGYQVAKMNSWDVRNDTTKLFSPKWIYNMINNGVDEGADVSNAYEILSVQGDVRFSECTPTGVVTLSEYASWYLDEDALEQALKYRVVENEHLAFANTSISTPVTSYNSDCLNTMKSFINEGYVLTIETDFDEWDYKTLNSQSNSELNGQLVCIKAINSDNEVGLHQMAVVGYDDTIAYDLNGNGTIQNFEKGAFKLVNSHGTGYGNDGFIWVMYDALNSVSNATGQNSSYRKRIFNNNSYDIIVVDEFPLDLVAKVTIRQNLRNQTEVNLGVSSISGNTPTSTIDTLVNYNRPYGGLNYSGILPTATTGYEEATFVFDYGDLFNVFNQRMKYYVSVSDRLIQSNSTTIKKVELVDCTGKSVAITNATSTINGTTTNYVYKLGLVGDVDNDGNVTTKDATAIQKHISDIITLTTEDLLFADVNGDGNVTASDATTIQKYAAGIITELPNGKLALLP